MTEINIKNVLGLISAFITARGESDQGDLAIEAGTELLAEGLLDSFALVELIADLEDALGMQLSGGVLIPEDFETPAVLLERLKAL